MRQCSGASARLDEITQQTLGASPARWKAWWSEHGSQPRAAWLVDALEHRDLDVRVSAIDELARATSDDFGYFADGPRAERDAAIGRWQAWYEAEGRRAAIE